MKEKAPSFMDMIKGFAKDVVDYAKEGAPHVTENQYKDRITTCGKCPDLKRDVMRCGKCGCLVEHKARWATTTCPANKWDPVKVGSSGKRVKLKAPSKNEPKDTNTKAGD